MDVIARILQPFLKILFPAREKFAFPPQLSGEHLRHTPELDGIRGWACASVLIVHCFTGLIKTQNFWLLKFMSATNWFFLGGVDLFFVLSGFLIGGILLDSKSNPHYFSIFWIRRIARIFPVAYLMLATYTAALFLTSHFNITRFDTWLLAEYRPPLWTFATFTQSLPIALGGYSGPRWMAMTWSLAIEEQFYLLFPFLVYFLPRKKLVMVVIGGLIIAPILRDVFEKLFGTWYAPYVLLPSRMDALLYGVAGALIIRNKRAFEIVCHCRRLLDLIAIIFLYKILTHLALFPLKHSMLAIMWGIVILRIYTCPNSFFNKLWRSPMLANIGLISYALYMYHQMVNGLIHGIVFNQEPIIKTFEHMLAAIIVIAIAIALSILSYVYFESPIRRYGAKLATKLSRREITEPVATLDRVA